MLLTSLYATLTVITTTDINLLLNQISSPLPIIRDKVPILWFYWAVPFFLLGIYLYFNISMQRIWESLSQMPAIFTDGLSLEKKAYPWLLLGIINAHFDLLKKQRPALWLLQNSIAAFLAWCIVPATLLLFWIKYLPQHSWPCTIFHILMLAGSLVSGFLFYRLAGKTLQWKNNRLTRRSLLRCSLAILAVMILLFAFSSGGFYGRHPNSSAWRGLPAYSLKKVVPSIFRLLGVSPFAQLEGKEVSLKLKDWTGKMQEENEKVIGAKLPGRNLVGARARDAYFAKAQLQGANLAGADLSYADLQGANLRGTNFSQANLANADLGGADLKGAILNCADLRGADLIYSLNITTDQLAQAVTDENTKMPAQRVSP